MRHELDRYSPRNENFVLVSSQEPEARSQNLRAELKAAGERKYFWLLASVSRRFLAGYQGRSPMSVNLSLIHHVDLDVDLDLDLDVEQAFRSISRLL